MALIGTWQDVLGKATTEVQTIANALREVIKIHHPDVFEEARIGDNAVSYGWGARKNTEGYAYLMPHKDRVNLGFYQGTSLPDPSGLLEGTGKLLRHIKVRTAETTPAIEAMICAARDERKTSLGIN